MNESSTRFNYWIEAHRNIENILQNIKGIILLAHNSVEFVDIVPLLQHIHSEKFVNVLYISLVRSYKYMRSVLEQQPLDSKRLFFIDCVSGFAFPDEDSVDDCLYHRPPSSLDQLKDIISFGLEKVNPDVVVLDSLSQFITFAQSSTVELEELYHFLENLRLQDLNLTHDTFVLLYDNKLGVLSKLPKEYTDLIINVEQEKFQDTVVDQYLSLA